MALGAVRALFFLERYTLPMLDKRLPIVLGIVIALAPFLGLPYVYLMWILPLLGVAVIVTAFLRRERTRSVEQHEADPI